MMMSSRRHTPLIFLFAILVLLAGCTDRLESEVSGRLTLDGKPIGPGLLMFVPVAGGQNPAVGNVQRDGSYTVTTNRTAGLIPGQYRVSVSVLDIPPDLPPGQRIMDAPFVHPEKYNSLETSGLEYEIKSGSNKIDIKLTSE